MQSYAKGKVFVSFQNHLRPETPDERLEETAKRYDAEAAKTRGLIGRLVVPSYLDWYEANYWTNLGRRPAMSY